LGTLGFRGEGITSGSASGELGATYRDSCGGNLETHEKRRGDCCQFTKGTTWHVVRVQGKKGGSGREAAGKKKGSTWSNPQMGTGG